MKILTKDEFFVYKKRHSDKIKNGSLFAYPTDTIYGIGANANDEKAVKKIRQTKKSNKPFTIIAPSKQWIYDNCEVDQPHIRWIDKLPGPYTLVMKLKKEGILPRELLQGNKTVGVRIPAHWISQFVEEMGIPIVTTSVNETGKVYLQKPEDLPTNIKRAIDFFIDEGYLKGRPSTIVRLDKSKPEIIER